MNATLFVWRGFLAHAALASFPSFLLKFTYALLICCHSRIFSRFELLSYDIVSVTLSILIPISYVKLMCYMCLECAPPYRSLFAATKPPTY